MSDDDEVELHEQDTLLAGDGLCDRAAVRTLVEEGPAAIQELIDWGAEFDREGQHLAFTREGAHSRNRVIHAHGDSTGREIGRSLYLKAQAMKPIVFREFEFTTELVLHDGRVIGARVLDKEGRLHEIRASSVLLPRMPPKPTPRSLSGAINCGTAAEAWRRTAKHAAGAGLVFLMACARIFLRRNKRKLCCLQYANAHRR